MSLGIDAGSKYIKVFHTRDNMTACRKMFFEHHGKPLEAVSEIIHSIRSDEKLVLTGPYGSFIAKSTPGSVYIDETMAVISALKQRGIQVRHVVNVGAGSIKYISLDETGEFQSYHENSLCAAGTGSFIDEQMHRMNYTYDDVAAIAPVVDPPTVATRCAVFAKSDIIHRQQEGHCTQSLWSGLCRGVVSTMLHSVFKGALPEDRVLFIGGLFLNPVIKYWVERALAQSLFADDGHFFAAIGASLAGPGCIPYSVDESSGESLYNEEFSSFKLLLERSSQANYNTLNSYSSDAAEVRIHSDLEPGIKAIMGIDIGSTSTKLVLIDADDGSVVLDMYRKTRSDPIGAVRILFREIVSVFNGITPSIVSCATTGSGRKLIGELVGADIIVNEITAHYRGARELVPDVDTIIEIGGQDSKFIRATNGMVVDCNMNFVCAAGTGSFIEEQAHRLGYDVRDVGDAVYGLDALHVSDRCTVFMEQDINRMLGQGKSREEALAAVVRAIANNYLTRVVGPRPITGETIAFMGATARNKGLVAAFEQLTGKKIAVSPHCHVMGAYGAAMIARDSAARQVPRFRGLNIFQGQVTISYHECADCANHCTITKASFENGSQASWGHMCGREESSRSVIQKGASRFMLARTLAGLHERNDRKETKSQNSGQPLSIGISPVLAMYQYMRFWRCFWETLGCRVVMNNETDDSIRDEALRVSRSDFCYPVKIALGHASIVSKREDIDALFIPAHISDRLQKNGLPRVFCPYVISYASVVSSLNLGKPVLSPTIDFRRNERFNTEGLFRMLEHYGYSMTEIRRAYRSAMKAHLSFQRDRFIRGKEIVDSVSESGKPAIVFFGRPYNLYDNRINLNLPERFRSFGFEVLPYDFFIDPDDTAQVHHMYWNFGEAILKIARTIRDIENIYPVYFTNFTCGPDSFILSRFEKIMAGKPYLIIELDEHGAETGYVTRIEAFADIVNEQKSRQFLKTPFRENFEAKWRSRERKLWIPAMHEITARLFAAGFRAWGYESEDLPVETKADFEFGKSRVRGGECLPAITTIGTFIRRLRETGAKPEEHALFMPTAEGPCRFGQYSVLHRSILDSEGLHDTAIFAPSSVNSYMGMPNSMRLYLWEAMLAGDMIMKAICRTRPYEMNAGETDEVAAHYIEEIESVIENRGNVLDALKNAVSSICSVPVSGEKKPLVGIVGEIYVRCNPFCNSNLIRTVEKCGGESWLSPISEWVLYTSWFENYYTGKTSRMPLKKLLVSLKTDYLFSKVRLYEKELEHWLGDRREPHIESVIHSGAQHLPLDFEGEAILTIGRAVEFLKTDAAMVVNCAPFGCMPVNITSALLNPIQQYYRRPVVTMYYDGESEANKIVEVYLHNVKNKINDEKELLKL